MYFWFVMATSAGRPGRNWMPAFDKADIACYLPDGTEIDHETLKK